MEWGNTLERIYRCGLRHIGRASHESGAIKPERIAKRDQPGDIVNV